MLQVAVPASGPLRFVVQYLLKNGMLRLVATFKTSASVTLVPQMAKLSGFKVIATCSKSKEPIARSTGADEVIVFEEKEGTSYSDYSSVDIVQRVQEITGGQGAKAVRSWLSITKLCAGGTTPCDNRATLT